MVILMRGARSESSQQIVRRTRVELDKRATRDVVFCFFFRSFDGHSRRAYARNNGFSDINSLVVRVMAQSSRFKQREQQISVG